MAALLLAEHDNKTLAPATAKVSITEYQRRGSSILSQKCYVRRPLGLSITRVGQWETHIGTS